MGCAESKRPQQERHVCPDGRNSRFKRIRERSLSRQGMSMTSGSFEESHSAIFRRSTSQSQDTQGHTVEKSSSQEGSGSSVNRIASSPTAAASPEQRESAVTGESGSPFLTQLRAEAGRQQDANNRCNSQVSGSERTEVLRQLGTVPVDPSARFLVQHRRNSIPTWVYQLNAEPMEWCIERPIAVGAADMARMVRDNPDRDWCAFDELGRQVISRFEVPSALPQELWVIVLDHTAPAIVYWVGPRRQQRRCPALPTTGPAAGLIDVVGGEDLNDSARMGQELSLSVTPPLRALYTSLLKNPIFLSDAMALSESRESLSQTNLKRLGNDLDALSDWLAHPANPQH